MLSLYVHVVCGMVPVLFKQNNTGEALELCERGLDALSQRGRLFQWRIFCIGKGIVWKNCTGLEKKKKTL